MPYKFVNIAEFDQDPSFFSSFDILLTVKSFDLQAIRKRYLSSLKRGKTGSIERREPSRGGLVYMKIRDGKVHESDIIAELLEPRGIDAKGPLTAVSSEDKIYIFSMKNDLPFIISNTWLSYIHTVRFDKTLQKILVTSSGVDTILEFDIQSQEIIWEWCAWEHGFNEGVNPETGKKHILTRSADEASQLQINGKNHIYINNPRHQRLPTALRAAFMNTAEYDKEENIIATLFHHGQVISINKNTNKIKSLIGELSKPHGGMLYKNGFLVTDTAGGKVVYRDKQHYIGYDFAFLPGKDDNLRDMEWLQISRVYHDNILTLDSNRNTLTVFNPEARKRMHIHYNKNWALQEFVFIEADQISYLKDIKIWFAKARI